MEGYSTNGIFGTLVFQYNLDVLSSPVRKLLNFFLHSEVGDSSRQKLIRVILIHKTNKSSMDLGTHLRYQR